MMADKTRGRRIFRIMAALFSVQVGEKWKWKKWLSIIDQVSSKGMRTAPKEMDTPAMPSNKILKIKIHPIHLLRVHRPMGQPFKKMFNEF